MEIDTKYYIETAKGSYSNLCLCNKVYKQKLSHLNVCWEHGAYESYYHTNVKNFKSTFLITLLFGIQI